MGTDLKETTLRLLAYCRENDWAGYDPYDALNSELFKVLPFLNSRLPRLALTQALKRSPVNLRSLLLVPKTQNPKALALFLTSVLKLSKLSLLDDASLVASLIDKLVALRSSGTAYWCWGYSFPWQTRTIIVPRGTPNLVCTIFVANALLDAFESGCGERCLEMASGAADYIARELYWSGEGDLAGFSYPLPSVRARIHNANFLAAALLSRVASFTGNSRLLEPALRVTRYSASQQRPDGSWFYGELPKQQWIDNFHTGYNLNGLRVFGLMTKSGEFEEHVRKGFAFYRAHFFREDGAARYFHNRTYPIDVHCVAQSLITLLEFKELDSSSVAQAQSVYKWARAHMWDPQGYFYYRVLPFCTIKTSYMRWSQAWMLLGLCTLLEHVAPSELQVTSAGSENSESGRRVGIAS